MDVEIDEDFPEETPAMEAEPSPAAPSKDEGDAPVVDFSDWEPTLF